MKVLFYSDPEQTDDEKEVSTFGEPVADPDTEPMGPWDIETHNND